MNIIHDPIRLTLHRLGFSPRHTGYRLLAAAIPMYARNDMQSITKEVYPALARQFGYRNPCAVEHPIRYAIYEARAHGDPELWEQYFPRQTKAPSNMTFIATMAELLE